MKIENMIGNSGKKVANQFIISDNNTCYFQSYDSIIVKADFSNNYIELGKDWNYSRTTAKYRNKFFELYKIPLQSTKEVEKCLKNEKFIDSLGIEWKIVYNSNL